MISGMKEKIEATFQKLDQLTQVEIRVTAAQSLEVLYGLLQNMRVLMDGKRMRYANLHRLLSNLRQQGIDGQYPRIPRYVLRVTMKRLRV
jgi:hypothetical protein